MPDEGRVRGELLALQVCLDLDEITEDEYDRQETILLGALKAIREEMAGRGPR